MTSEDVRQRMRCIARTPFRDEGRSCALAVVAGGVTEVPTGLRAEAAVGDDVAADVTADLLAHRVAFRRRWLLHRAAWILRPVAALRAPAREGLAVVVQLGRGKAAGGRRAA